MTITRGSILMAAVLMVAALGVAGCPKRPGSAIGSAPTPSGTASAAASGSTAASGQGSQASAQAGAGGAKSGVMQPSAFSQAVSQCFQYNGTIIIIGSFESFYSLIDTKTGTDCE